MSELSKAAVAKRREYKKEWNAKNRDKCKEYTQRYWEKKASEVTERKETDEVQS